MLMSCAVTAQLVCVFVFAYAKILFSRDADHMVINMTNKNKEIILGYYLNNYMLKMQPRF